jgi:hypothetical protein
MKHRIITGYSSTGRSYFCGVQINFDAVIEQIMEQGGGRNLSLSRNAMERRFYKAIYDTLAVVPQHLPEFVRPIVKRVIFPEIILSAKRYFGSILKARPRKGGIGVMISSDGEINRSELLRYKSIKPVISTALRRY